MFENFSEFTSILNDYVDTTFIAFPVNTKSPGWHRSSKKCLKIIFWWYVMINLLELVSACHNGPLTRHVKLWVVHAPGMPVTFSPPPTSKETDIVSDPGVMGTTLVKYPYTQESRQQHPATPVISIEKTRPSAQHPRYICLVVEQCQVRNKKAVPQPRATINAEIHGYCFLSEKNVQSKCRKTTKLRVWSF